MAFTSRAQFGTAMTFPLVAGDTLTNVDTVFKQITTTAGYRELGAQVLLKKISGTVTGKMILWASTDAINYFPTDSMTYVITSPSSMVASTYDLHGWIAKTGTPFPYYAVLVTNTATGGASAQVRVKYTLRKTLSVISQ